MGFLFLLCLYLPDPLFLERESAPAVTNDLREGAVVGLDGARDVFLAYEIGTEEHEGVGRAWDVAKRPALAWGRASL